MRYAYLLMVLSVFVLGACANTPSAYQEPKLTFAHVEKYPVSVSSFDVIMDQTQGMNITDGWVNTPKQAVYDLIQHRVDPVGMTGRLVFDIEKASIVENEVPVTDKVLGIFNVEPSKEYVSDLLVKVDLFDEYGALESSRLINAKRGVTIPNKATLVEREKARFEMIEKLVNDFDKELVSTLSSLN